MNTRILTIEAPTTEAVVEFLDANTSVTIRIVGGRLEISARMSHGEESSTWDEHEVTWPLLSSQGCSNCIDGCRDCIEEES